MPLLKSFREKWNRVSRHSFILVATSVTVGVIAFQNCSRIRFSATRLPANQSSMAQSQNRIQTLGNTSSGQLCSPTITNSIKVRIELSRATSHVCRDSSQGTITGALCTDGPTIPAVVTNSSTVSCDQVKLCGIAGALEDKSTDTQNIYELTFSDLPPGCIGGIDLYEVPTGSSEALVQKFREVVSVPTCRQSSSNQVTCQGGSVPQSRTTACTSKPPHTEWNVVSEIAQTQDSHTATWVPTALSRFSQTPSTLECVYKCESGYVYDQASSTCTQIVDPPVDCGSCGGGVGTYTCGDTRAYDQCPSGTVLRQSGTQVCESSGWSLAQAPVCEPETSLACTGPGNINISNGASQTYYQTPTVPYGQSCIGESRVCTQGVLSGTFTNQTCAPQAPSSCTQLSWVTVPNGGYTTAYREPTVPFGGSCVSEARVCDNGMLSGSYTYPTCTVQSPTCSGGKIPQGNSCVCPSSHPNWDGQSCYRDSAVVRVAANYSGADGCSQRPNRPERIGFWKAAFDGSTAFVEKGWKPTNQWSTSHPPAWNWAEQWVANHYAGQTLQWDGAPYNDAFGCPMRDGSVLPAGVDHFGCNPATEVSDMTGVGSWPGACWAAAEPDQAEYLQRVDPAFYSLVPEGLLPQYLFTYIPGVALATCPLHCRPK